MAIIYSYPSVASLQNPDLFIISRVPTDPDEISNFSVTADALATFVTARVNLNFQGGVGTGVVNLDTQSLNVIGTTNEIETTANAQTLQIGLPNILVVPGTMRVVGTANFDSNVTMDVGLTVDDFLIADGNVRLLGPTPFGTTNTLTVNGNTTHNGKLTVTDHLVVTGLTPSTLNALTSLQVDGAAAIGGVLTMEDNIDMTLNGNIINLLNPVQAQDAATKAYVDSIVSGGLSFKGSFRADTGEILSGINTGSYLYNCPGGAGTRVAVSTGDYYIVANTGGNFYCSGDLLNIGDSIIAVADAAADSSTVNDWATLESDNIEGTGVANTIPLWTDSQVLGDSILSQDAGATKVTISGALDLSSSLINNVLDPVAAQDAATKSYVDLQNAGQVTGSGDVYYGAMWDGAVFGTAGSTQIISSPLSFRITDTGTGVAQPRSLAFGGSSTATGPRNSVALGYDNTSSAEATLATGHETTASGMHAASFNFQTNATGEKSAAFGDNTTASGKNSFAIGSQTIAATSLSFAGGKNSTANPDTDFETAFAYGSSAIATGNNSAAFGLNTQATGERSFVTGNGSIASGNNAVALGGQNQAVADQCFAAGFNNESRAPNCVTIGSDNYTAYFKSTVIGNNLTAGSTEQVVLGRNNAASSANFVVGCGPLVANKKNGLEITAQNVKIPQYGTGTPIVGNGSVASNLAVDSNGTIIETSPAGAPDYLSFVCLLSQSGSADPQPDIVLENSLGIPTPFAAFTRVSAGIYNLNATGKFKSLKTIMLAASGTGPSGTSGNVGFSFVDADNLRILTSGADNFTKIGIEIRTYN